MFTRYVFSNPIGYVKENCLSCDVTEKKFFFFKGDTYKVYLNIVLPDGSDDFTMEPWRFVDSGGAVNDNLDIQLTDWWRASILDTKNMTYAE